jgi:nucleoside-diphosphate-sugar epimerase
MRVLITGGLGYLGSVLAEELVNKGFNVTIVDIELYRNFLPDYLNDKISFVKKDVRSNISEYIQQSDVIIHLAAIVGDAACDLIKEDAVDININGTKNIGKLCKEFNKKLIYTSTCSVYGSNSKMLKEDSEVKPLSIYALSKLAAENILEKIGGKFTIFRLATLFGYSYRMRFDLVVNTFIEKSIKDGEITVFGGDQWRPFLHVRDAAEALIKCIEKNYFEGEIFNLNSINIKIIDLAKEIQKILKCEIKIINDIKDPRNYRVNTDKAKNVLGFNPKRRIEDAIMEIKKMYEANKFMNTDMSIFDNVKYLNNYQRQRIWNVY